MTVVPPSLPNSCNFKIIPVAVSSQALKDGSVFEAKVHSTIKVSRAAMVSIPIALNVPPFWAKSEGNASCEIRVPICPQMGLGFATPACKGGMYPETRAESG